MKKALKELAIPAGFLLLLVIVGLTVDNSSAKTTTTANTTSSSSSAIATTTTTACPWTMSKATPKNGNWIANGVKPIQDAKNVTAARKAASVWLEEVRGNPGTLKGAAQYLLGEDVNTASLVNKQGCATATSVALYRRLQGTIGLSKIEPSMAPANGNNSGTHAGIVLVSSHSGISGNRKAVKVTTVDGRTVWVMARCGNAVYHGKPKTAKKATVVTTSHKHVARTTPPKCTTCVHHTPPPPVCKTNCGHQPPSCKTNCSPPPPKCAKTPKPGAGYTWNQGKCKWTPPKKCNNCVTRAQVSQPVQDNTLVEQHGVNTGPTVGAPKTAPEPNPTTTANKAGVATGTSADKAPEPAKDNGAGHSTGYVADNGGAASGSTSDSGGTSTGSAPVNAPVDSGQGSSSSATANSGMPPVQPA